MFSLVIARRFIRLIPYIPCAFRYIVRREAKFLFDAEYYRTSCLDFGSQRLSPILHFLLVGGYEGRNPHALFDAAFYVNRYRDVQAAYTIPWLHYLRFGGDQGRQPHPLFDPEFYCRRYPDVQQAGVNPLLHYIRYGAAEGRKPHRLFQPDYYECRYSGCAAGRPNALIRFVQTRRPGNPHPLFDCEFYVQARPEAAQHDVNALMHYTTFGPDEMVVEGSYFGVNR